MKPGFRLFFYLTALMLFLQACDLKRIEDNSVPSTGGGTGAKFQTTVGGNANDFPRDVIAVADGGFVIVGVTQSFTTDNNNQAYLVKIDSKGKQVWEGNFGGAKDELGSRVTPTSDGGYVMCGITRSFGPSQDSYVVKVNSAGSKVWEKYYGAADSTETPFGIVPVGTAGDLLVAYNTVKTSGVSQLKLLRLNSNGSRLSDKLIRSGNFSMTNMIKTSDSKIVIIGEEFSNAGTITYIIKLNEDGSFVWENRYPAQATNYTPSYGVAEMADKSIVVAGSDLGSNDHDFNLLVYNAIGGKVWGLTWGGASADELFGVVKSTDGQIVVMGYTSSFNGTNEFYLSKRKATDGSKIWEKDFVNIANLWGGLAVAADGGYIMVAGQNQANSDIIVVKTDTNGEYK